MATGHEAIWICLLDASSILWLRLCWQPGTSLQLGAPKNTCRPFPKQQVEDTGRFPPPLPALFLQNPSKTLPEGIITVGPFLELSPVALAPVGVGVPELQPLPQPLWQNALNPRRAPTLNLLETMEQPGTTARPVQSKATTFHRSFCRVRVPDLAFPLCSDYQGLADLAGMCWRPDLVLSRSRHGQALAGRGMSAFLRIILRSSGPPVIRSRWPASGNFKICRDVRDVHIHRHTHAQEWERNGYGEIHLKGPAAGIISFFLSFIVVHHRERKST